MNGEVLGSVHVLGSVPWWVRPVAACGGCGARQHQTHPKYGHLVCAYCGSAWESAAPLGAVSQVALNAHTQSVLRYRP